MNSYTQNPSKEWTAINRPVKYFIGTINSGLDYISSPSVLEGIMIRIGFEDQMKSNLLKVIYLPLVEELCLENLLN